MRQALVSLWRPLGDVLKKLLRGPDEFGLYLENKKGQQQYYRSCDGRYIFKVVGPDGQTISSSYAYSTAGSKMIRLEDDRTMPDNARLEFQEAFAAWKNSQLAHERQSQMDRARFLS